jgi:hypothetical protein
MADPKSDKKTESLNALKNANKHLADLFTDLNKKDLTLQTCSADLQRIAAQCGDLRVSAWVGQQQQMLSLKGYLETIAKSLNEAR